MIGRMNDEVVVSLSLSLFYHLLLRLTNDQDSEREREVDVISGDTLYTRFRIRSDSFIFSFFLFSVSARNYL